jgi:nitroreductase
MQTTTFVIVDDPDLLSRIRAMHATNVAMQQARAYIACVSDGNPEAADESYSFQVEDCAAAVENILLAVTALGYATVWIDGWLRAEDRARKLGNLIGLPEDKVVRIILPLGVPAEAHRQREKKPFEDRAWYNRYGARS